MRIDATPRLVSGEIMTAGVRRGLPKPVMEVIDAEFWEVVDEPSLLAAQPDPRSRDLQLAMLKSHAKQPASRSSGALFWTAGLTLAASVFWISGGHALAPTGASLKDSDQLSIAQVHSRVTTHAQYSTLLIDGEARNDGESAASMPPIAIAVTALDGAVTHYTLSTNAQPVAAGDLYLFSSRLRVPPGGVRSVAVLFQPAE